jgi:hypothetical protein
MSVLERRFCCPGSLRLERDRPGTETEYSRRGTELHNIAARALTEGLEASDVLPDDLDGQDILAPWLATVRRAQDALGGEVLIEHRFSLADLHELYWGTADAVIVAPPALWVGDLKTGGGHPVPVRRQDGRPNFQLAGYALGVLQSLPPDTVISHIMLCVVQPRRNSMQLTEMSFGEVMDLAGDLVEIAERALAPDAPLVPGEHCAFCRGAVVCPALHERALTVAATEFDDERPIEERRPPAATATATVEENISEIILRTLNAAAEDEFATDGDVARACARQIAALGSVPAMPMPPKRPPADLTPEQLALVLDAASLVKIWIAAVEAHARGAAERGLVIPGWKLAAKRSTRKWISEEDASAALTFLLEENRFAPPELLSPAQAERALKRAKLAKPKTWDELITWTDPGTTLVPADDPRPAVAPSAVAALEFETEKAKD